MLVGLGLGFGTQQASLAIQTVLTKDDIPFAISHIFFGIQFGGSIFVCVGQNIFNQQLIQRLTKAAIPWLNISTILSTGATELRDLVHEEADLIKLLFAYNQSLTSVFYVAAGAAVAGILGALLVGWKSVKGVEPVHRICLMS